MLTNCLIRFFRPASLILGLTILMSKGFAQLRELERQPFVLGQTIKLHSGILGEDRLLNIYLPEGYRSGDTMRYPVVYLLDGSADEDFIHVAGIYQFNTFPWIRLVRPSIVVGIGNVDRKRDFTFPSSQPADRQLLPSSGHSESFIRFLESELIPFINRNFPADSFRTIIGQSLGGLLATEILLKRPGLFNQYIIISPSLWWDDGSLLKYPSPLFSLKNGEMPAVYIGVGREGLTPGEKPHVMEVDANLLAEKLRQVNGLRVFFDYLPNETHATITHQAVFNALRLLNQNSSDR